tara:strand:- start:51 stop:527 length:477 start_codon:yes stop_codon:yes gene_type:complete
MAITINGSGITSANIADGAIVNADVSDLAASKLTGALPAISGASLTSLTSSQVDSGSTTAKAWVNFNGTGTVAIRAAYNVSSITDIGTGQYTINFTTAMVDADYAANGSSVRETGIGTDINAQWQAYSMTAASFRIRTGAPTNNGNYDSPVTFLTFFR